jgi:polyphenol oxidase
MEIKSYHVTSENRGNGIFKEQAFDGVDGFMTNEKNVVLTLFFADCVPLFFYDPQNHVIALSHAGWKGTAKQIGIKTVRAMNETFGSEPKNIRVGIGPSIGHCCYEVSEDVKKEFDLSFNDDIIASVVQSYKDKYRIDLWKANELSLISCGILKEHIEMSALCTQCHSDTFFSHRSMGAMRGSQVGIMALV